MRIARYMCYGHFLKQLFEAIFIDRLAGRTVPITSTLWRVLFYWIGFGGVVGFSLFHPELMDELTGPTSIISKYLPASFLPANTTPNDEPQNDASFGG